MWLLISTLFSGALVGLGEDISALQWISGKVSQAHLNQGVVCQKSREETVVLEFPFCQCLFSRCAGSSAGRLRMLHEQQFDYLFKAFLTIMVITITKMDLPLITITKIVLPPEGALDRGLRGGKIFPPAPLLRKQLFRRLHLHHRLPSVISTIGQHQRSFNTRLLFTNHVFKVQGQYRRSGLQNKDTDPRRQSMFWI